MKTAIIIPTYNEKESIVLLIQQIFEIDRDFIVIVVDDSSPDGTGEIVESVVRYYSNLKILHRGKKQGRGSACVAGFQYALGVCQADYIIEMDADLSHNPQYIPSLVKEAQGGYVVIGSRYVQGSRVIDCGIKRRIFSKLSNSYARFLLRIPINDYTGGFRCYSADTLKSIDFRHIKSRGYIVLSEIAYLLYEKGYTFKEIPITFVKRMRGTSNFNLREIISAFITVIRLAGYKK